MKVAIIDGASFVLPYDHELARQLVARGQEVAFFGSRTAYNEAALDATASLRGSVVRRYDISGTVASRWRGLANYLWLWSGVLRRGGELAIVNLQFSIVWPLEFVAALILGKRFLYTVHNAVPHGYRGQRHRPTLWLASIAPGLVFPSQFTHDDFLRRYGERFRARARVVPHGPAPVVPGLAATAYLPPGPPAALVFWSNVKAYKGIELFADLAIDPALRGRGIGLEIYGAWDADLRPERDRIAGLGVTVLDRFLSSAELLALLARPVVFLLPYHEASQSGALYALLHHGCYFICADVGDLGAFMRRYGLEALLLRDRSARAVLDCLDALVAEPAHYAAAFAAARAAAAEASDQAVAAAYAA